MTKELSKGFTGIEINGVRFSNISEMLQYMDKQRKRITELEKENAELRYQLNKNPCVRKEYYCSDCLKDIEKAKELLKQWLQTSKASGCDNINIVTDTEQFIKDSEVEK